MKKLIGAVICLAAIWWFWASIAPAAPTPPGTRISETPEQTETFVPPWTAEDFEIHALARYRIKARVLSKKRYYLEHTSGIAPLDLALGWGDMSDSANLAHISVEQSGRWFRYSYNADCPIPQDVMARQSANVHCLPADGRVRADLNRLRVNSFAELRGFLVEVKNAAMPKSWKSSLVRDDEGAGACEVFWITDVFDITP